jgi:Cu+-exporting ATPase
MTQVTKNNSTIVQEYRIEGAGCASCVGKIEKAINQVSGVDAAAMNFAQRTVTVDGNVTSEQIISAVEGIGYKAIASYGESEADKLEEKQQADEDYYRRLMRNVIIALGVGVPLMLYGLLGGSMIVETATQQGIWFGVGIICAGVMYFSGKHFYIGAWKSLINHNANMDSLIALGTGTAWLYSMVVVLFPHIVPEMARHLYFEASAMIIGLINLGLALEVKARGKTSEAIQRLIGLQTKTACVIRGDQEIDIPIEHVQIDDLIRIKPGEKIPVDGVICEGKTFIDESMLTGEPMPVEKMTESEVVAGTLNKSGSIIFKATRIGKDTALAQIINMVKRAQNSKPSIGRMADTISGYFVPIIMIIAIVSALAWLNIYGVDQLDSGIAFAMIAATSVLIIACPCALGLATPMSIMVGVGKAAESGVLIRNGEALQTAAKITTMILDKTGTITQGKPQVTDIISVNNTPENELLSLAASIEAGSEHPLGEAIVEKANVQSLGFYEVTSFQAIVGQGVEGELEKEGSNKKHILLGNQKLMFAQGIDITNHITTAQILAQQAKTPMYIAIDHKFAGIIAVADPIKDDSVAAINRLKSLGIRVVMLTGDNVETAKAVAQEVGVDEYFAEVLPEDKVNKVAEFQRNNEIVGMTGDGINDAPALALANVGFAIGTGTDVAIESADVTLMRGSLHGITDAIVISKATINNIKQNLVGAFIYNIAGVPFAAGAFYVLLGVMLNPVVAGAAMAFSSLTVVTNANRLRFFNPSKY